MHPAPGKRALATRRTRRVIRRSAMRLFLERGFDKVTTTEIARDAGVSPATLFNYFRSKEDLFFGQTKQLERELRELVESCGPGASILQALQSHVLYELTAGRDRTNPGNVAPFHRQVAASASLQAREHEMYDYRELVLAEALTAALGPDSDPLQARVAARLYIAAEQLVAAELRDRFAATDADAETVLREIEPFIAEVFAILSCGLGELPAVQQAASDPVADPAADPVADPV